MRTFSAAAILEQHKLYTDKVWLILLEITLPTAGIIYLCSNNETVVWNGNTYSPFPFEISGFEENDSGEIPAVNLKVSNVSQDILVYLLNDPEGGSGIPVAIKVVTTAELSLAVPEIELNFQVQKVGYDAEWITFELGAGLNINRRCPRRRFLKDFCPFVYGGNECRVLAATKVTYPTCARTLADCRIRSNSARFGGEPGIPLGGFYASI